MRVRTWKILDRGKVPLAAREVSFTCTRCWREAMLPVLGRAEAQVEMGVVFDPAEPGYALPKVIQCRKCRRIFSTEEASNVR